MFSMAATSDYLIWGAIALIVIIVIAIIVIIVAKKRRGDDEDAPEPTHSGNPGKHSK